MNRPDRRDIATVARLRRIAVKIDRGVRAGKLHFRSPDQLAGRAEPMGLRGRGRIRDYHYILSELRNRATYRHQVTSQRRRAHLVLDIRDMADGGPRDV